MARVSIYVSDELKARMVETGDALNWSDIARPAFETAIATFNHQRGRNMGTVIERLRASKAQFEQHSEVNGNKAGRSWAADKAAYAELRAVAEIDLDEFERDPDSVQTAIARAIDPENTYWRDMPEILFGDRAWPSVEWLLGWIEGARDLFEEVEGQL